MPIPGVSKLKYVDDGDDISIISVDCPLEFGKHSYLHTVGYVVSCTFVSSNTDDFLLHLLPPSHNVRRFLTLH